MLIVATTYSAAGKGVKFASRRGLTHLQPGASFRPFPEVALSLPAPSVSDRRSLPRSKGWCLALLGAALLAACEDAPTVPRAYVHPAEGTLWVAITVPPGLPDLQSWTPYLRGAGPQRAATLRRVRALQSDAERARRAGDLDRALRLEEEALRLAADALPAVPDVRAFPRSFTALDAWLDRAETQLAEVSLPQLETAVQAVRTEHGAAERALQAGDTAAAVLHLGTAALRVREYEPSAVALRVLERATQRLEAQSPDDVNAVRARRLLANARAALLERQDTRALQRALYALQIADGQAASEAIEAARLACTRGRDRCPEP